jgi:hypothetical protein
LAITEQFFKHSSPDNSQLSAFQDATGHSTPFLSLDGHSSPQDEQFAPPLGFRRAQAGVNRVSINAAYHQNPQQANQQSSQQSDEPLTEAELRALQFLSGPPPGMPIHLTRPEDRSNPIPRQNQRKSSAPSAHQTTSRQLATTAARASTAPKRRAKDRLHQLAKPAGINRSRPSVPAPAPAPGNTGGTRTISSPSLPVPATSNVYLPNGSRRLPPLHLSRNQVVALRNYALNHQGRIPFRQGLGLPAYGRLRAVGPGQLEVGVYRGPAQPTVSRSAAAPNRVEASLQQISDFDVPRSTQVPTPGHSSHQKQVHRALVPAPNSHPLNFGASSTHPAFSSLVGADLASGLENFVPQQPQQLQSPNFSSPINGFTTSPLNQPSYNTPQMTTTSSPGTDNTDSPGGEPVYAYTNGPIIGHFVNGNFQPVVDLNRTQIVPAGSTLPNGPPGGNSSPQDAAPIPSLAAIAPATLTTTINRPAPATQQALKSAANKTLLSLPGGGGDDVFLDHGAYQNSADPVALEPNPAAAAATSSDALISALPSSPAALNASAGALQEADEQGQQVLNVAGPGASALEGDLMNLAQFGEAEDVDGDFGFGWMLGHWDPVAAAVHDYSSWGLGVDHEAEAGAGADAANGSGCAFAGSGSAVEAGPSREVAEAQHYAGGNDGVEHIQPALVAVDEVGEAMVEGADGTGNQQHHQQQEGEEASYEEITAQYLQGFEGYGIDDEGEDGLF